MPCYKPLKGWLGRDGRVTFVASEAYKDTVKEVACGRCIGCRLEYSRMWAVRCVHEAQMHEQNCFLTLTYAPEHLPDGGTLVPEDFVKFIKRLRKRLSPHKFSYFHCGEYGDNFQRPHYHALIFGFDFADKRYLKKSGSGHALYTSELLDKVWGFGDCYIGDLNFETAAYTARYAVKKITGDAAAAHYEGRHPEYCSMSTKPAIGKRWFDKYADQVYRRDRVVVNGVEQLPPRYYDKLLRRQDDVKYQRVKAVRSPDFKFVPPEGKKKLTREQSREQAFNRSKKRLVVREEVQQERLKTFKRNLK